MAKQTIDAWLARDRDGELDYYLSQPYLNKTKGYWIGLYKEENITGILPRNLFSQVTYENSPVKCTITIETEEL